MCSFIQLLFIKYYSPWDVWEAPGSQLDMESRMKNGWSRKELSVWQGNIWKEETMLLCLDKSYERALPQSIGRTLNRGI